MAHDSVSVIEQSRKLQQFIALLPDHPTPIHLRTHTAEPVPFCIWHRDIEPDEVQTFDEAAAAGGVYGQIEGDAFINLYMRS